MHFLLTGDFDREEIAPAAIEMRHAGELVQIASLESAAGWLARAETPVDLTIVAQARAGQFSHAAIEILRAAAPLTPIVALLGSWCEGEMRSGLPWPGVPRVYWHQWSARFRQEVARLARGELSGWSQPLTATAEERLLWSAKSAPGKLQGMISVVSDECEMADWLAAACRARGLAAITMRPPPPSPITGIDLVLCDVGIPSQRAADDVRSAARSFPGAVVVVLADFPRNDDVQPFLAAGAAAVLSKPLDLADLLATISRFLPPGARVG
ncbi:MAG TPA: hypothetical protein VNH11_30945 [Pirellulales bacterium]|nr:hypothetical protein [Pirellulales bacterium]